MCPLRSTASASAPSVQLEWMHRVSPLSPAAASTTGTSCKGKESKKRRAGKGGGQLERRALERERAVPHLKS